MHHHSEALVVVAGIMVAQTGTTVGGVMGTLLEYGSVGGIAYFALLVLRRTWKERDEIQQRTIEDQSEIIEELREDNQRIREELRSLRG